MLLELIGSEKKKDIRLLPKGKKGKKSDIKRDFPSKREKHCTESHTEKYFPDWSN